MFKQFNDSLNEKEGANFLISSVSSYWLALAFKTISSSSFLYGSTTIRENRERRASDNFVSSPVLHVAITLNLSLKFLNSFSFFVVNVPGISSTKVKLCLPENNSLNLYKTIVFT